MKSKHKLNTISFMALGLLSMINLAHAAIGIDHTVTVSTSNSCLSTSSSITVDPGTDVYFCYKMENTGTVDLNLHNITTNFYGPVLVNDTSLVGASSNSSYIGPARTINSTTALHSTWTSNSSVPTTAYKMLSSADTNGPTYNFVDISGTGTALGLGDDGEAGITLPFAFEFYDNSSSAFTVGNNGALRFGLLGGAISAGNTAINTDVSNNLIAPFWDDIDSDTGDVYWEVQGTTPDRVAIIQWENRPHFSNVGSTTFEVKLFETSNKIEFHYKDVQFGNANYDFGASATVGVGGSNESSQFSFNTISISDSMAISFSPYKPAFDVTDTTSAVPVPYNFQDISAGGTALTFAADTDDGAEGVTMPFVFTMGNITSNEITIGNNGALRLGTLTGDVDFDNLTLADDTPANIIAPLWDDLSTTGTVYWVVEGSAPNRVFIVQYDGKDHYDGTTVDVVTFQVQLFEGSNIIEFHYQDATFDGPVLDYGSSATVGILGGASAVEYSFETNSLSNLFAIRFAPRYLQISNTAAALVVVNAPDIDLPQKTLSLSINPDTTKTIDFDIDNIGSYPLTWSIEQDFIVKNQVEVKRAAGVPPIKTTNLDYSLDKIEFAANASKLMTNNQRIDNLFGAGSEAYTFTHDSSTMAAIVGFDLNNPAAASAGPVFPQYANIFVGDFLGYDTNTIYAINENNILLKIIPGSTIEIAKVNPPANGIWSGMTWDFKTGKMLIVAVIPTVNSVLYSLDVGTGVKTAIGNIGVQGIAGIAADLDGMLYGVSISTDELVNINTTTGAGTSIGPLGINADGQQGLDFDFAAGILYWISCIDGATCGNLRTIDTATGTSSLVGQVGPAVALYAPLMISKTFNCTNVNNGWLSMSASNGVTAAAGTSTVTLTVDATGLPLGTDSGNFCIYSNDPDEPIKYIPLILDVNDIIFKNGFE